MVFLIKALRQLVGVSIASTVVAGASLGAMSASAQTVNGAGATFPAPLYQLYAREIKKEIPSMKINYQAIGSGGGIREFTKGTVDFGGSDSAMSDAELAKVGRGTILVPTAGGAVVLAYNLPGVTDLKLSRKALAGMFCGQIKTWDHPELQKANPGVDLPSSPIKNVVRSDSSGTTFIFTNHLSSIDAYCKGRLQSATKLPSWPQSSLRGNGNSGVTALVKRTPNSIGYVEFSYAKQNKLTIAKVQNRKGQFISPSLEASNLALSKVNFPENFRVFEGDPDDGYPIVGLTWVMVYKKYPSPAKADAVKKMVEWMLTDGQKLNARLDYVAIPEAVANRVLQTVKSQVK